MCNCIQTYISSTVWLKKQVMQTSRVSAQFKHRAAGLYFGETETLLHNSLEMLDLEKPTCTEL